MWVSVQRESAKEQAFEMTKSRSSQTVLNQYRRDVKAIIRKRREGSKGFAEIRRLLEQARLRALRWAQSMAMPPEDYYALRRRLSGDTERWSMKDRHLR